MKLVTYECQEPLSPGQRFITWLTQEVHLIEKGKRTGEVKLSFLPVYSFGSAREVAEASAMAFWHGEIARKQAKQARGKTLSLTKGKSNGR